MPLASRRAQLRATVQGTPAPEETDLASDSWTPVDLEALAATAAVPLSRHSRSFAIGDWAVVAAGLSVNVRIEPKGRATAVAHSLDRVRITGSPTLVAGRAGRHTIVWWPVTLEDGRAGWVAGNSSAATLLEPQH